MNTRNIRSRSFQPSRVRRTKNPSRSMMDLCNVPERYVSHLIDQVVGPEGDTLRRWMEWYSGHAPFKINDPKRSASLLLHGKFGHGKTAAAVSVLREFFLHGATAWFETEMSIFTALRSRETTSRIRDSWLVVVDDVGSVKNENFGRTTDDLEMVLRSRINVNLPTIVTTNLDLRDLYDRYESLGTIFGAHYTSIEFSTKNWRRDIAREHKFDG